MTAQEAKEYMEGQVKLMLSYETCKRSARDIIMQVTGMMKAFRAAGIVKDEWKDMLHEILDLI